MIYLTMGDLEHPDFQIQLAELEDAYKLLEWIAMVIGEYPYTIEKPGRTVID